MEENKIQEALKESILSIKKLRKELEERKAKEGPIAVIGMACRLPGGVHNAQEFWRLLTESRDAIVEIPKERWDIDALYDRNPDATGKMYTRYGGFIENHDQFDALFFGISPAEAEAMDPQQRILLQTTWEAFENAGLSPDKYKGSNTGVFIGITSGDYVQQRAATQNFNAIDTYDVTGNTNSTASGRISYAFDFLGPNMAVDTACSSSLVSVHLGCQSLWSGESDMVVAGGVNLILRPNAHIIFSRMKALAPDGRCKTFDASADGFCRSEGCGIVLLKRLKDAERDQDNILAIIDGTAINQDGKSNGLTAPNGMAQQRVIQQALRQSKLSPEHIDFIECHGTGTPLGDPIEVEAITKVFKSHVHERKNPIYLGAVKSNMGHLESAAGITAFIKTVLCLQHKTIPANLHFKKPSEHIQWQSFLQIPTENIPLNYSENIHAGISAFGFSGTNAHVILSSYQKEKQIEEAVLPSWSILTLSAKSPKALIGLAQRYSALLQAEEPAIQQLGYSSFYSRSHHAYRHAIVADSLTDLRNQLQVLSSSPAEIAYRNPIRKIAFVFTGQGSQYTGMGNLLYQTEPKYREALDQCNEILLTLSGISLLPILFETSDMDIMQTNYGQPAIFMIEYALCKLLQYWGVVPDLVLGHSVGEITAACISGIINLEDAIYILYHRGRWMQAMEAGAMTAITTTSENIDKLLQNHPSISLAAANGKENFVLSGPTAGIQRVEVELSERSIHYQRLPVSRAFHSTMMNDGVQEFERLMGKVTFHKGSIPIISNVTGKEETSLLQQASYWIDHVSKPVRFYESIQFAVSKDDYFFLEIGPSPTLTGLIRQSFPELKNQSAYTLRQKEDNYLSLYKAFAAGYEAGLSIYPLPPFATVVIPLPTYPFEDRTFWLETIQPVSVSSSHPLLGVSCSPANEEGTSIWTSKFSVRQLPFIADHKIQGQIIFPAACYTEMVISAILSITGTTSVGVSNLQFKRLFVVDPESEYEMQTIIHQQSDGNFEFRIYSRNSITEKSWMERMQGRAETIPLSAAVNYWKEVQRIIQNPITQTGNEFYLHWDLQGNNWGKTFRGVSEIWKQGNTVAAKVIVPEDLLGNHKFHSHPALLDICGQLMASFANQEGAFVGKSVNRIQSYFPLTAAEYISYARVTGNPAKDRTLTGDVYVFDTAGHLMAETLGLCFEFIGSDYRRETPMSSSDWFYETLWENWEPGLADGSEEAYPWLYMISGNRNKTNMITELRKNQIPMEEIHQVDDLHSGRINDKHILLYVVDDILTLQELEESIYHLCLVFQKLSAQDSKVKVYLITTSQVGDATNTNFPLHAAFAGLYRSLKAEYQTNSGGFITITSTSYLSAISHLLKQQEEDMIRVEKEKIVVPRLKRLRTPSYRNLTLRPDSAYLITGGMGTLGLRVADWLIDQGARRIILMGRTTYPPRNLWTKQVSDLGITLAKVLALEKKGAAVDLVSLDISNETDFDHWWKEYHENEFPPVRGFIHAAGIVLDMPLGDVHPGKIQQQLAAKVGGAMVLEKVGGRHVDFGIYFSSASAVLNSPRIGVYAAANAFMDAMAEQKTAAGFQRLSIQWGAWADEGMAAGAIQLQTIPVAIGMEIMEKIWNIQAASMAVIPSDSNYWKQYYALQPQSYYSQLVGSSVVPTLEVNKLIYHQLKSLLPSQMEEGRGLLINYLQALIGKILRLDSSVIISAKSLSDYGLDSMMAIEIKNRIESEVKVTLQVVDLIGGPSIDTLASVILERFPSSQGTQSLEFRPMELPKGRFELSPGQQALWALHARNPNGYAYNVAFSTRIISSVRPESVYETLITLLERHPTLRSRFIVHDGRPLQEIRSISDPDLLDFQTLVLEATNHESQEELVLADSRKPFDLTESPLVRVRLYTIEPNNHILLFVFHHLLCDGWSLWLLLDEFRTIYSKQTLPPPPAFGYHDFIQWQKNLLENEEGERLRKFWKKNLEGYTPVTALPFDRDRPEIPSEHNGAGLFFEIENELFQRLTAFVKQESTTLFTAALAAFKILLYKYSGEGDIIIGTPTSGRSHSAFMNVVGDFINMTAIRSQVHGVETFRTFVKQLTGKVLQVLSHQDLPFPILVKELHPDREHGVTPIFQVMFSLQQAVGFEELHQLMEGYDVDWGELRLSPFKLPQQEGQFDLTLELIEGRKGLTGFVKYNIDLFDESTILRIKDHFLYLLQALITQPELSIGDVSFLSPEPTTVTKFQWCNDQSLPAQQTIHELIAARTKSLAHQPALTDDKRSITYQELEDYSNSLANYLISLSARENKFIGICMERSVEMVVAMLAILKSGAAYVPIDPKFPKDRIAYMVEDSGMKFVVTNLVDFHLLDLPVTKIISVITDRAEMENYSNQDPRLSIQTDDLAYLIYTSGTTGHPKGTLLTHGNVINFFQGMNERLGTAAGKMLAVTTLSFDIAVLELLWTLSNGYEVVIQSEDIAKLTSSNTEHTPMDFSLFYFSSSAADAQDDSTQPYRLLLEGAVFADTHDFKAIWTPERHFHPFGGLYPNAAVSNAALSTLTKNIQLRAGSVVAPLHHALRMAEDWAMIDNLSNGRVGISFASGWQANDFVLASDNFKNRNELFTQSIQTVKKLWKGEKIEFKNGEGVLTPTRIFPLPLQKEIPIWITAAGNEETFRKAGESGAHLLTHLLTQSVDELARKVQVYRKARTDAGYTTEGIVTLMLHTFIGTDPEEVKEQVRKPFYDYLLSSFDLMRNMATQFGVDATARDFEEQARKLILPKAFDRYFETSSLMGTPEKLKPMVEKLHAIGITEIACLIDFGLEDQVVLDGLVHLNEFKNLFKPLAKHEKTRTVAEQLRDHKITHLQCTPSLAKLLIRDEATRKEMQQLQVLLLGGERLPVELVHEIYPSFKGKMYNMYGPTETTIWSSVDEVPREAEQVFLGKPIANTRLHILNRFLEPVAANEPGELFIAGKGLAKGYWNREELTLQKFIYHPWYKERLYATGDMVRYDDLGRIEYLERKDHQVKINGYRIEPEEIERVIKKFKDIHDVAVVPVKGPDQVNKLVAYVESSSDLISSELREFLRSHLPVYMIPGMIKQVHKIPLTANGKVDKKKLMHVKEEKKESHTYTSPTTHEQAQLVLLWQDIFHLEQVGIDDNFFELGGDSIQSIQLVSAAKERGILFSVNDLFRHQTIAELAEVVKLTEVKKSDQGLVTGKYSLLPAQAWFFAQEMIIPNHYNQALLLEIPKEINSEHLQQAMERIRIHHDALRTRFLMLPTLEVEPEILAEVTHSVFEVITLPSENWKSVMEQECSVIQSSLDLNTGKVFQACRFIVPHGETDRLLMVAHHLVIDGFSWRIILKDLRKVLDQLKEEKEIQLSLKTDSVIRWTEYLQVKLEEESVLAEIPYWEKVNDEVTADLPLDHPQGETTHQTTACYKLELDKSHTFTLLTGVSNRYNTHIHDVLMVALLQTFAKITGSNSIRIDLEGHGRNLTHETIDITQTVGWFTAFYPVVLKTEGIDTLGELIKYVKEQLRQIPNQGDYYGVLRFGNKLSKQPTVNAPLLFNYLGQTDADQRDWPMASESAGPIYAARNKRTHPLEFLSYVSNGIFHMEMNYSSTSFNEETIATWAQAYKENLEKIIAHCSSSESREFTPSDFPGLKMNQKGLDQLLSNLKKK